MAALLILSIDEFCQKASTEQFFQQLCEAFHEHYPEIDHSESEKASWRNSLPALASLLTEQQPTPQGHILIEYLMPIGPRRADCVLVGQDESGPQVIVVELKQWSQNSISLDTSYEVDWLRVGSGGNAYYSPHPCEQAIVYQTALEQLLDFGDRKPTFHTLAYLHGYEEVPHDLLRRDLFKTYLADSTLVTRNGGNQQARDMLSRLKAPTELYKKFESPTLRYSDSFITNFSNKLDCSTLFESTQEQRDAFQKILKAIRRAGDEKVCVIVKGIVGTGKTVLAMKLINYLMKRRQNPQYYVKSAAIGDCLKGLDFFPNGAAFTDHLVIDEAHRLNQNQVASKLKGKKLVVFFIDDNQWLHPEETCRSDTLKATAEATGFTVVEHTLQSQLRCENSDDYINWVEGLLLTGNPKKLVKSDRYLVKVVDHPTEMEEELKRLAQGNITCRMVGGYCWTWETARTPGKGNDIEIEGWTARWNEFKKYRKWNEKQGFHGEVGAVYTVQGFEYGYTGVLIGNDLKMRDGQLCVSKSNYKDPKLLGWLKRQTDVEAARATFAQTIRNIYYILLTRARHGVLIYAEDQQLRNWLKELVQPSPPN
jgi:DUF2075 family protein